MGKNAIENAEQVIEAFGGIRPMAKKIDVAVTTVQGWKKRNVIPGTRRALILNAAAEHDVDLAGLMAEGVANAGANENTSVPKVKAVKDAKVVVDVSDDTDSDDSKDGDDLPEAVIEAVVVESAGPAEAAEEPAVTKEDVGEKKILNQQASESFDDTSPASGMRVALVSILLIALGVAAISAFYWQQANNKRAAEAAEAARIAQLEQELLEAKNEAAEAKEEQGFFGKIVPQNLDEKIADFKTQANDLKDDIGAAAQVAQEKAKAVSSDVLAENAGTMQQRIEKLQLHVKDIAGMPVMVGMMARIDDLKQSEAGEDMLDNTVRELDSIFGALQLDSAASNVAGGVSDGVASADDAINATLDKARAQSDAIGQTFDAVPQDDLKAAAMLLGMSQLRSALNRDNEAFESDLSLLRKVIGDDKPELSAALDRLAPQAQSGVLTPSGLSAELRSFAGDAVAASLAGEDVTVKERAKARMNELFEVQKNGELLSGTDTQATLVKAKQQLQANDVQGAIDAVQGLDGGAAAALLPWLEKAQGTLNAQDAKGVVDGFLGAVDGVSGHGGKLIQNEETGINIYVPKKNNTTY